MKISVIGSGNVAWHLSQTLENANHTIFEVYSRDIKNAKKLCDKLYNAEPKDQLDFSKSKSELFIISVKDDAIQDVVERIQLPINAILVHTSGTVGIEVLKNKFTPNIGVFYPLQSFSKSREINFKNIPICIEASNTKTETVLEKFAFTFCDNVAFLDSEDRKKLHLAAVFACNFSNHVMAIAEEILTKEGLKFEILHPLIQETFEKALSIGPQKSQTGPAIRKDKPTLKTHLNLLRESPTLQKIYILLSNEIAKENLI